MESIQMPVSPVDPSLSRGLSSNESIPRLSHSLHELHSSVLSLASSDDFIFSGSQNKDISVWCKNTFRLKDTLRGHTGSVLALEYARDREWLFSSSGDSTIRIWSATSLKLLYIIDPYLETGAGDLFCLTWSKVLQTIYIGCQNTSLQWLDFKRASLESPNLTTRKVHKFFDSYPLHKRRPADVHANNPGSGQSTPLPDSAIPRIAIPMENVVESAHVGYIYSMSISEESESGDARLVSGSGDETIKIWNCTSSGPVFQHEFECNFGAVLALVSRGDTIYGGCQDGVIKVLDMETRSIVRTIIVQEGVDILSLSMIKSDLYACLANGRIMRYSASFDCTASWQGHSGIVLSSIITRIAPGYALLTGGNDDYINIWDITVPRTRSRSLRLGTCGRRLVPLDNTSPDVNEEDKDMGLNNDVLEYALSKFISFPSVSSVVSHREDCRQAAIWLKKCLSQLGAQASLLATGDGVNPLVLGTFAGIQKQSVARKPRILFYGHYDVVAAPPDGWNTDPFSMIGQNGYLYGRGVTDDKGPVMSVAFAAASLLFKRRLDVDLVFLIEGEEERGSTGFEDAVRTHKDAIGEIDAILISNSTWITDDHPCITYGLRGVVHCDLKITSGLPDLHSGVDGGGVVEPMDDMIQLLATLTDHQKRVKIPGFYDQVRPQSDSERLVYEKLSQITNKPARWLSSRWSEPSLTIHTIEASGPLDATVIPGTVKSQVSIRIVPDQDVETISISLQAYLRDSFETLGSPNKFTVEMKKMADWWLGQLDDPWFKALESAVKQEWGTVPLHIREGGSIPSIPYLEKEFGCHALHLPIGQTSDQAHLPNERISLINLKRGKSVIEHFLLNVAMNDMVVA